MSFGNYQAKGPSQVHTANTQAIVNESASCRARAVFTLQGSSVAAERIFSRAKYVNAHRMMLNHDRFERFAITAANTRAISNRFPGFRSVDLEN